MLPDIKRSLQNTTDPYAIDNILNNFMSEEMLQMESTEYDCDEETLNAIEESFGRAQNFESIISNLEQLSLGTLSGNSKSKWANETLQAIKSSSPIATLITYEAFKRGSRMSLREALRMELGLATQLLGDPEYRDFSLGVAAKLAKKPVPKADWAPKLSLNSIREKYFDKPAEIRFEASDEADDGGNDAVFRRFSFPSPSERAAKSVLASFAPKPGLQ